MNIEKSQQKTQTNSKQNSKQSSKHNSEQNSQDSFQDRLSRALKEFERNTAIEYGGRRLTYGELDRRSGAVAAWLTEQGIAVETFIGLSIEDRLDFICALIGILKARCVFVPLDPAYPDERLESMARDVDLRWIITSDPQLALFKSPGPGGKTNEIKDKNQVRHILLKDMLSETSNQLPGQRLEERVDKRVDKNEYNGEDKVYVYFTSGTTGKPKAIVGRNQSLLHFIDWEIETFKIAEGTRFSQFTNVGFDALLRDVFVPLCAGGIVCIPPDKEMLLDSQRLIQWTDSNNIQAIHCVPSFFRILNSRALTADHFKHLNYVFLSGEKIVPSSLINWYNTFESRIQLVNFYGPTETTMIKAFYLIQKDDAFQERIPIGKAMKGARLLVLDNVLNPCKEKVAGEIYIRTPYRTHGYCNSPN